MVDQSGQPDLHLRSRKQKQLYPLRIEGRKFGEQVTTPASGIIEDDCVITYPPLPEGTTRIDWMDDNLNSETNTYGILLVKPQETKEQASSARFTATGSKPMPKTDGTSEFMIH